MTTQVKPKSSGSFTSIALNSTGQATKATTFGITLTSGQQGNALRALNEWRNAGGAGTAAARAAATADGQGLALQEI
jgi:hypothetical protein